MIELTSGASAIDAINKVGSLLSTMDGSNSLSEYTSSTRVEPIALIESTLVEQPYMTDVLQTLTTLFSGYYLQAIALSNKAGQMSVASRIDKFNPNRDVDFLNRMKKFTLDGKKTSVESSPVKLPMYGLESGASYHVGIRQVSLEAPQSAADQLRSAENLAVGKVLEVTIEEDGNKLTIPIQVRLMPLAIRKQSFLQSFSGQSFINTAKERYYRWRSGELKFVKDLLLCQDLIDNHSKNLIKDDSGFYRQMSKSRRHNKLAALLSNQSSVAAASNMAIIDASTAVDFERQMGMKLDSGKSRNDTIFNNSSLMLLVVVDTQWERVTIYHRGVDAASELSLRQIKSAGKGGGPDVEDIMKAYMEVTAPKI